MSLDATPRKDWLHTDADHGSNVRLVTWLHDVAGICYNAFTTSAGSDKTAFAVHFLDALNALKSSDDARCIETHVSVF